jgi:type II secretion system protein J
MNRARLSTGGFSLVEALVSLFVLGLISAGAVLFLVQSVRAQEGLRENQAALRDIQMTQALLSADLAQLAARRVRRPNDQFTPRFSGGVEGAALAFVRAAAATDAPHGATTQAIYVEYVFRNTDLIRRTRSAIDPVPESVTTERVLLPGLKGARVQFFDGVTWSDTWLSAQSQGAPRAVAVAGDSAVYGPIRIVAYVGLL